MQKDDVPRAKGHSGNCQRQREGGPEDLEGSGESSDDSKDFLLTEGPSCEDTSENLRWYEPGRMFYPLEVDGRLQPRGFLLNSQTPTQSWWIK